MQNIEVLSRTQRIVVHSQLIATVSHGPQKIIVHSKSLVRVSPGQQRVIVKRIPSVSVINAGPQGPPGASGDGVPGPPGPPGPPGSAGETYVHNQAAASATWVVIHNLGLFPNVTTVDTAGTVTHGAVHYDSVNQLTITFSVAQSGNAYLS